MNFKIGEKVEVVELKGGMIGFEIGDIVEVVGPDGSSTIVAKGDHLRGWAFEDDLQKIWTGKEDICEGCFDGLCIAVDDFDDAAEEIADEVMTVLDGIINKVAYDTVRAKLQEWM